jgi:hypothetical protein
MNYELSFGFAAPSSVSESGELSISSFHKVFEEKFAQFHDV